MSQRSNRSIPCLQYFISSSESHYQANNFALVFPILLYYIYLHQILDCCFFSMVAFVCVCVCACVCVCVCLCMCFFFFFSFSFSVMGATPGQYQNRTLRDSSNNFNLKIDAFSVCTLWVTAFRPFITFAKSFILDLTGFHALVLVVSASSF